MKVCLKAVQSSNRVIGYKGRIPWYVKGLNAIHEMVEDYPLIMGRKTADLFVKPVGTAPNVIVTGNSNYKKEGFKVCHSSDAALDFVESQSPSHCFIVGGGSIFRQFIEYTDIIYLVTLLSEFKGDTFFPQNFAEKFAKTDSLLYNSNINFTFETYLRNDN